MTEESLRTGSCLVALFENGDQVDLVARLKQAAQVVVGSKGNSDQFETGRDVSVVNLIFVDETGQVDKALFAGTRCDRLAFDFLEIGDDALGEHRDGPLFLGEHLGSQLGVDVEVVDSDKHRVWRCRLLWSLRFCFDP